MSSYIHLKYMSVPPTPHPTPKKKIHLLPPVPVLCVRAGICVRSCVSMRVRLSRLFQYVFKCRTHNRSTYLKSQEGRVTVFDALCSSNPTSKNIALRNTIE